MRAWCASRSAGCSRIPRSSARRAASPSVSRPRRRDRPERALYGHGWDVFGLYAFGNKLQDNCARCPETTRAVESIRGLRTAGFSMLQPGTHIRPHVGYSKAVLRCHLGLIVPGGCTMRVGAEIRAWEEGRCLIFDDTTEHEVWHRGSESRVVLLIDFVRTHAGELAPGPNFL